MLQPFRVWLGELETKALLDMCSDANRSPGVMIRRAIREACQRNGYVIREEEE